MIHYKEALGAIISSAEVLNTELIPLAEANQRVLATSVFYDLDMPPFDKSAMDGYACKREDLGNELTVMETLFAGKSPQLELAKNQCSKIMTGAPVPSGADCIFMQEDAKLTAPNKVICTNSKSKTNICYKGEDIKKGDLVIEASTLIQAKHLPLLASAGIHSPEVFVKPKLAVIATGTELVEPSEKPATYQIRNSNSSQLIAQINTLGIEAQYKGIIGDSEAGIQKMLDQSSIDNDVLLLTGGVSVGEYDLVPKMLEANGFEIIISKTAIQPGKPMVFAKKGNNYCFGLSGNPVSSFIQFEIYVKPFLYALMGHRYNSLKISVPLATDYKRRKSDRLHFVPASVTNQNKISPIEFHGSAHIDALKNADCLFEVPVGVQELRKNDLVNIRLI